MGGTGGGTDGAGAVAGTGAVCERGWGLGGNRLADFEGPRSAAAAAPRLMKDLNSYLAAWALSLLAASEYCKSAHLG